MVFGGHLTLPKYEIVDCSGFCGATFSYIPPENLLEDFFYTLNGPAEGRAVFSASLSSQILTRYFKAIFHAPFFKSRLLPLIFIFIPFIKETLPLQKVLVS